MFLFDMSIFDIDRFFRPIYCVYSKFYPTKGKGRCFMGGVNQTEEKGGIFIFNEWASLVFVLGPEEQTILVRDFDHWLRRSAKWALPGGKGKGDESPRETAVRKLLEETGIRVPVEDLSLINYVDKSWHRNPHAVFIFCVKVESFDGVLLFGAKWKYVAPCKREDLLHMRNFLTQHKRYIEEVIASGKA